MQGVVLALCRATPELESTQTQILDGAPAFYRPLYLHIDRHHGPRRPEEPLGDGFNVGRG